MGQTSGSDKDYIYKDKSERYHYMNTFYIFAVVILWVLFVVYLLAKLVSKSIAVGTAVGNVVLIILFAVDDFYHSKWKAVQELMKAKSRLPEKSQKVFAKALKLLWSEGNKTVRKTVKQVVGEKRR